MNKITTAGTTALVLGGTLALLAPTAQAATHRPAENAGTVQVAALPSAGHQTAYVQRDDTVTVYRDGKVLAEDTAESAAHPRGKGKLVLTVEAKKNFSFRAGQFLWEDEDGGDTEATNPKRKISVPANRTKTVSIAYRRVGDGDVIWAPGPETVAGAWLIEGRAVEGASELLPASYVQRGSTVTVYKAGDVVAKVTPKSATYGDEKGVLKLGVKAVKKFELAPASFLWEDADGGDHEAAPGQKPVTVKARSNKTITVKYADVAGGSVIWSPREDVVAGAWSVD